MECDLIRPCSRGTPSRKCNQDQRNRGQHKLPLRFYTCTITLFWAYLWLVCRTVLFEYYENNNKFNKSIVYDLWNLLFLIGPFQCCIMISTEFWLYCLNLSLTSPCKIVDASPWVLEDYIAFTCVYTIILRLWPLAALVISVKTVGGIHVLVLISRCFPISFLIRAFAIKSRVACLQINGAAWARWTISLLIGLEWLKSVIVITTAAWSL